METRHVRGQRQHGLSRREALKTGLAAGAALASWPLHGPRALWSGEPGHPYVDGVEWLVLEDESTGLAMYRTGQIDVAPWHWWSVRQQDLDALKKTHPNLVYRDFLSNVKHAIFMRTDMPPFSDVRVRRAISHAIDREGLIEAVWGRGEPTAAVRVEKHRQRA